MQQGRFAEAAASFDLAIAVNKQQVAAYGDLAHESFRATRMSRRAANSAFGASTRPTSAWTGMAGCVVPASYPPRVSDGNRRLSSVQKFLISLLQEDGGAVCAIHLLGCLDRCDLPFSTSVYEQRSSARAAGSRTIVP
jgi:hypothetical protein